MAKTYIALVHFDIGSKNPENKAEGVHAPGELYKGSTPDQHLKDGFIKDVFAEAEKAASEAEKAAAEAEKRAQDAKKNAEALKAKQSAQK